jgi:hypothetical protein
MLRWPRRFLKKSPATGGQRGFSGVTGTRMTKGPRAGILHAIQQRGKPLNWTERQAHAPSAS